MAATEQKHSKKTQREDKTNRYRDNRESRKTITAAACLPVQ